MRYTWILVGWFLCCAWLSSVADAQLTSADSDYTLHAPYRGPVSAWRNANLDMAYGEILNLKIYRDEDADTAQITGTWDRSRIRIFSGFNASGQELSNYSYLSYTSLDEGGNYYPISIKAISSTSNYVDALVDDLAVTFYYETSTGCYCVQNVCCPEDSRKPYCDTDWDCKSSATDDCDGDGDNDILITLACNGEGDCCSQSGEGETDPQYAALKEFAVSPTALSGGVSGSHAWYPGNTVLNVVSGAAFCNVTVNETVSVIGQSFIVKPNFNLIDEDDTVESVSMDVRLPGMPETMLIQPKSLYRYGTPWSGHMVGYWFEERMDGEDTYYDVTGPNGTVYRFSTPGGSEDKDDLYFLTYIIPAGLDKDAASTLTASPTVEYNYTTENNQLLVSQIADQAGNTITFTRNSGTLVITADSDPATVDRSWTITPDEGYIWSIERNDCSECPVRIYTRNDEGQLTGVISSTHTLMEFAYDTNGDITTELYALEEGATLTPVTVFDQNTYTQTNNPGGSEPARSIDCDYIDGYLDIVTVGSGSENEIVTMYTWDVDNAFGNVVLLEKENLTFGNSVQYGYASAFKTGENERGMCGMDASGEWKLAIVDHRPDEDTHWLRAFSIAITDVAGNTYQFSDQGLSQFFPINHGSNGIPGYTSRIIEVEDSSMDLEIQNIAVYLKWWTSSPDVLSAVLTHNDCSVLLFYRIGTTCDLNNENCGWSGHAWGYGLFDITFTMDTSGYHRGDIGSYEAPRDNYADYILSGDFYPDQRFPESDYCPLCAGTPGSAGVSHTPFRMTKLRKSGGIEQLISRVDYQLESEDGGLVRVPQVIASYDVDNNKTEFTYTDSLTNRLDSITGPLTDSSTQSYVKFDYYETGNQAGLLHTVTTDVDTDASVIETRSIEYDYDSLRRLISKTIPLEEPLEDIVTYFQPPGYLLRDDGLPQTVLDPYGYYTEFVYDNAGRVTHIQKHTGQDITSAYVETIYTYDTDGFLESVQRPLSSPLLGGQSGTQVIVYERNPIGWTSAVSVQDATSYEFDRTEFLRNNLGEAVRVAGMDGLFVETLRNSLGLVSQQSHGRGGIGGSLYENSETTYLYNSLGHLKRISSPEGWWVTITDDSFGRPQWVTRYPENIQTTNYYDRRDLLESREVTYSRGSTTQLDRSFSQYLMNEYDQAGQLVYSRVEGDNTSQGAFETLYEYYSDGSLKLVEKTSQVLDVEGELYSTPGKEVTYFYDAAGRIETVLSPGALNNGDFETNYVYSLSPHTVQVNAGPTGVSEDQRSILYTMDALGRTVSIEQLNSHDHSEFDYDTLSRMVQSKVYNYDVVVGDVLIQHLTQAYDIAGRPEGVTRYATDGGTGSITWDANYNDLTGRLESITNLDYFPEYSATSFAYDDENLSMSAHKAAYSGDSVGVTWTHTSDVCGRPVQDKVNFFPSVEYSRDYRYTYQASGDCRIDIFRNGLDTDGKTSIYENPITGMSRAVDPRNVESIVGDYHFTGMPTASIEDVQGLARPTTSVYGSGGELLAQSYFPFQGETGKQTTRYAYNLLGLPSQITYPDAGDGNNIVTREYNDFGELDRQVDRLGRVMEYEYDPENKVEQWATIYEDGSKTEITEQVFEMQYDALGRPTSMTVSDGTTSKGDSYTVTYDYDPLTGKLSKETQSHSDSHGTYSYDVDYTYNAAGHLLEVEYPDGNSLYLQADGVYDYLGRPRLVRFGADESSANRLVMHTWLGLQLRALFINAETYAQTVASVKGQTYDEYGRKNTAEWRIYPSGTLANREVVLYDFADNVIGVMTNLPGQSWKYAIDGLNRITSMVRGTANEDETGLEYNSEVYSLDRSGAGELDLLGNVWEYTTRTLLDNGDWETVTTSTEYNVLNQATSVDESDFRYDAAGNLVVDPIDGRYYEYNSLDQLTGVYDLDGATVTIDEDGWPEVPSSVFDNSIVQYRYDPMGRRILKILDDGSKAESIERYLYSGNQLVEVRDGSNNLVRRYFWSVEGMDTPIAVDEWDDPASPPKRFFFLTDRMGTPVAAAYRETPTSATAIVERYYPNPDGTLEVRPGDENLYRSTDFDKDGMVGATDLVMVRNAYTGGSACTTECDMDVCDDTGARNSDTYVDEYDLKCVIEDLGKALPGTPEAGAKSRDVLPTPTTRFGMHGLPLDEETGLLYARARYYHPKLQRWLNQDPKGYVDGGNLYEAFGSNPAKYTDPMGTINSPVTDPEALPDPDCIPKLINGIKTYYEVFKEINNARDKELDVEIPEWVSTSLSPCTSKADLATMLWVGDPNTSFQEYVFQTGPEGIFAPISCEAKDLGWRSVHFAFIGGPQLKKRIGMEIILTPVGENSLQRMAKNYVDMQYKWGNSGPGDEWAAAYNSVTFLLGHATGLASIDAGIQGSAITINSDGDAYEVPLTNLERTQSFLNGTSQLLTTTVILSNPVLVHFRVPGYGAPCELSRTGSRLSPAKPAPKRPASPVTGKPRVGSATKADIHHAFPDLVDNFAGGAQRFKIPTKGPGGQVIRQSELYQVEGSLNGKSGVFEWIVDQGNVTHRRFIPRGRITGTPNQIPGKVQ